MSLPTTNQNFVILKALDCDSSPIKLHQLVGRMKSISQEFFGDGAMYVYGPAPLSSALAEMSRTGDLDVIDGCLTITHQGRRELANTEPLIARSS